MEFLGIGPFELIFILIIILLVLGPNEMVKAIRTVGRVMREIVTSDWWASTKQAIQDVRKLPYDLMREAGLEDDMKALDEIRQATSGALKNPPKSTTPKNQTPDLSAWTKPNLSEPPPDPVIIDTPEEPLSGSQPFEPNAIDPEPKILPPDVQEKSITQNQEAQEDQPENQGDNQS